MADSSRKYEFDILRIFGIFMVLLNHKDVYNIYMNYHAFNYASVIASASSIIIKTGPPLFLMISGALLLEKEETIQIIMKHRVARMFIVLVVIALSMRLFGMSDSFFKAFLYDANWYIYSYIGYLLMLPFLRKMTKTASREMAIYFLVIAGLIFTIYGFVIAYNIRPALFSYIGIFATEWAPIVYNIIYPVGGLFLYRLHNSKYNRTIHLLLIVSSIITVVVASKIIIYDIAMTGGGNCESVLQHSALFPTWCIYYSALGIDMGKISSIFKRGICEFSKNTFGMYILEIGTIISPIYINELVIGLNILNNQYYIWCIIAVLIEVIVYNIIVSILRRIPLIKIIL